MIDYSYIYDSTANRPTPRLSSKNKPTWPRSIDNRYSPTRNTTRLARQKEKEREERIERVSQARSANSPPLIYDSSKAHQEGGKDLYNNAFWDRVRFYKDKQNYMRRQERISIRLAKSLKVLSQSRRLATNYYVFQKMLAFARLRQDFLTHVGINFLNLLTRQKEERLLFRKLIQNEDHFITLLYEDYYKPLNNRTKVQKNSLLHDLTYKKIFLSELRKRLFRIEERFIIKQRSEKRLLFLWAMDNHALTIQERRVLYRLQNSLIDDVYIQDALATANTT